MAEYVYQKAPADGAALQAEAVAAGVPVDYVNTDPTSAHVFTPRDLDSTEKTTLDGAGAAHVPPTKDASRRNQALVAYDDPDSPASLVELSGEYGLLDLINVLQAHAGINQTGRAQLRNAVRAIIKPGGTP